MRDLCGDISSKFFDYFKSDFFGFSKYINKCQKEILTCAPPSSHMCVCFSSTMTPFVLKYHLYSSKAGNISLRQMWCYQQNLLFNFLVSYLYSFNSCTSISEMAGTSATVTYNSMRVDTPGELLI